MDPICHTLVGAAMAEAGLKRRTASAVPTLLVAANLPDVDVFSYYWGGQVAALEFRRGWTHGVLAMAVLPLLLTGMVLLGDRLASRFQPAHTPASPGGVFLLSLLGVLSHPLLDFLNTYGVRFLMPFSGTWYYGDTLFIVDPYVWLALGVGVLLSRRWGKRDEGGRREEGRGKSAALPARVALGVVTLYIVLMGATGRVTKRQVTRSLYAQNDVFAGLMVAPVAANPFRRDLLLNREVTYQTGSVDLLRGRAVLDSTVRDKGDWHPAAAAAGGTAEGRQFLAWSRFPFYVIDSTGAGSYEVTIGDARYVQPWASVTVLVKKGEEGRGKREASAP